MKTFELNNIQRDVNFYNGKFSKTSKVVETFAAMVRGDALSAIAGSDAAVKYIKELGAKAAAGDQVAVSELNTLRRYVIEAPIMEEIKMLSIFGSYEKIGADETVEREVYKLAGEMSRMQAAGGDVVFPARVREVYPVATKTVSGGYEVDYRRVEVGDMTKENEGMNIVKTDILNRAMAYVYDTVFTAINNATIKYAHSAAGLTKAGVDGVIRDVRRNGKPTIVGDYALVSQLSAFAGYASTVNGNTITGISDAIINEIAQNGLVGAYNGTVVAELPNAWNEYELNADGTGFKPYVRQDIGFVIPTGKASPIRTWTRGGLTSLTGVDVHTGKVITRFDLEVAADVAKGQEHLVGILQDTNLA